HFSGLRVRFTVVSNDVQSVTGREVLSPTKATVLGPCLVIPQEHPSFSCRGIDLDTMADAAPGKIAERLIIEASHDDSARFVAYRDGQCWAQTVEPVALPAPSRVPPSCIRARGVYLITGGLGHMGLAMAEFLGTTACASLVLVSRSFFPPRHTWDD